MNSEIAKSITFTLILLITTILPTGKSITALKPELPQSSINATPLVATVTVFDDKVWEYWDYADLKGLDPWGDSESKAMDIVAIYEKEEPDSLRFRLDFLELPTDVITPTLFALDFTSGGTFLIDPGTLTPTSDIEWDLMVSISGTTFTLYNPMFTTHPDLLVDAIIDRQLDFVAFAISRDAFIGWDGSAFSMQAIATDQSHALLDKLDVVSTDGTAGKAKLVLPFGNFGNYQTPSEVCHYDGYCYIPNERPGERRGIRYILDAAEKYNIPLTHVDVRIEILPGLEYLRILERYRSLSGRGLLDPLSGLAYGHFMAWQPDDVDAEAIELAMEIRENLDLPSSTVFYPYEAMITPGDIQVIQDTGFNAIYGMSEYRYWFGWLEDWSDPEALQTEFETWRKVHVINGMQFVFDNRVGNYMLGAAQDARWEEINWDDYSEYDQFEGTDQGLHLWWRRILQDMAIDPDQEQFFTIGTDINLTAWIFQDAVDWNFRWLASHPWIEVTTFSSILNRGWAVIDHGNLGLAPNELLHRYQRDGDTNYNSYFPYFYYGGISDGHSPLIPAGVEIESYYDYIPYLREGALIQPPRIMGDAQTPGSVIYETLQNFSSAPDNPLTDLAWLSYFMHIGEQTWHDGPILGDRAKLQANFLLQVNKLLYAARWADQAANGDLSGETQVMEQDLDLDGENEYVMSNDQVLAIFENDGGRLEYAFAYDTEYGPIQLVSPNHQHVFKPESEYGFDYTNGEVAMLLTGQTYPPTDGAFVDHKIGVANQYGVYEVAYTPASLSFELDSFPVTKTFTLEGDTIYAQYQVGDGVEILHPFHLSTNRFGVFFNGWSGTYEELMLPRSHGWQSTSGGLAVVNFEDTFMLDRNSFIDSPARDEMMEREDPSTYPWGHYMEFPFSHISIYGGYGGNLSLTLRASPMKLVYLPVVLR